MKTQNVSVFNLMMALLAALFILNLTACGKEGAKEAALLMEPPTDTAPDTSPNLGGGSGSSPAGIADHSSRSPAYGTVATLTECQHIADNWAVGLNETWYFGTAWAHGGTTQNMANTYNAQNFLRLDRDGVVWRSWSGGVWTNHFLTNVWYVLGEHCSVHINTSLTGIDQVKWDNVVL